MTNLKTLSLLVEEEDKMTEEAEIANMIVNLKRLERLKYKGHIDISDVMGKLSVKEISSKGFKYYDFS